MAYTFMIANEVGVDMSLIFPTIAVGVQDRTVMGSQSLVRVMSGWTIAPCQTVLMA